MGRMLFSELMDKYPDDCYCVFCECGDFIYSGHAPQFLYDGYLMKCSVTEYEKKSSGINVYLDLF